MSGTTQTNANALAAGSRFALAMNASASTTNGALSYSSPDVSNVHTGRVSLFFKGCRGLNIPSLYSFLEKAAKESVLDTFLLAFNLRDPRGGKGEKKLGRASFQWLFIHYPEEFTRVMALIPEYGRWDDLVCLFPKVFNLSDEERLKREFGYFTTALAVLRENQRKVVELFGNQLKTDLENMKAGKPISLCAKWSPTEQGSNREFGVFRTLAKSMGVSPKTLRTHYNTPLRAYLKLIERFMCAGQWEQIDFNKVSGAAMKRLRKAFAKHQPDRFEAWKAELANASKSAKPTAKVNTSSLEPHLVVREVRLGKTDPVVLAQWDSILERVERKGTLSDMIAIVDTSGSMHTPDYIPLDVATTLGLIISQVVKGPFHGLVFNFNDKPTFCSIPDGNLHDRYKALASIPWGGSTNLIETFKLLLQRAVQCKLAPEEMPKKLVIISDMQFNAVDGGRIQTNFEKIEELYMQSGYTRPQIIFWNVNGHSSDFPVTVDSRNTVMISGFSPAILKSFLNTGNVNTLDFLSDVLTDSRYVKVRDALVGTHSPMNTEEFEVISM